MDVQNVSLYVLEYSSIAATVVAITVWPAVMRGCMIGKGIVNNAHQLPKINTVDSH